MVIPKLPALSHGLDTGLKSCSTECRGFRDDTLALKDGKVGLGVSALTAAWHCHAPRSQTQLWGNARKMLVGEIIRFELLTLVVVTTPPL